MSGNEVTIKSVAEVVERQEDIGTSVRLVVQSAIGINPHIHGKTNESVVMDDDAKVLNHALAVTNSAWGMMEYSSDPIGDTCKLAIVQMKLLTERRRLLRLSLEPDKAKESTGDYEAATPQEQNPRGSHYTN